MNKKKIMTISILTLVIIIIVLALVTLFNLSPINSKDDKVISFTVQNGWGKNRIVSELKKKDLIRNEFFSKVIIKLKNKELYAGTYKLSKDMSTNEIISMLENQENIENQSIKITFVEGKRLSTYVTQIEDNFGFSEDDIYKTISDKDFLNTLINKYWFLTDSILNDQIYYPLEGYLYPDTYEFKKDSKVEDIVYKMLDNMDLKLSTYKEEIKLSNYNIHELITLASIVELEGVNSKDRGMVAGVFYNRLRDGMTLGSDVTTYYGVKKDFSRDLTLNDLNSCNGYNTRSNCLNGLPVGPICSPGLSSLSAVIEPTNNDYYYFVADKEKNTYFSKDSEEHAKTVSKLKSEGKWYTY